MAHEILSAKLCEMDQQLAKLHSEIRMSDQISGERLDEEIARLQLEIDDEMELIRKSLSQSKAEISTALLMEFEVLQNGIINAFQKLNLEVDQCEDPDFQNEKQMLAAEYNIDFAVIVAKHALLKALQASRSQRAQEQRET